MSNQKKTIFAAAASLLLSTSCCWLPALVIALGGGSTLLGISNGVGTLGVVLTVIGLSFLFFGLIQFWKKRKKSEITIKSIITCPECGSKKEEEMPTDACQFFYECTVCQAILKPKESDCCVFCSYGTVCCPPVQTGNDCC